MRTQTAREHELRPSKGHALILSPHLGKRLEGLGCRPTFLSTTVLSRSQRQ